MNSFAIHVRTERLILWQTGYIVQSEKGISWIVLCSFSIKYQNSIALTKLALKSIDRICLNHNRTSFHIPVNIMSQYCVIYVIRRFSSMEQKQKHCHIKSIRFTMQKDLHHRKKSRQSLHTYSWRFMQHTLGIDYFVSACVAWLCFDLICFDLVHFILCWCL